ncbi:MAG: ornithine cyclodeaminase family protein, partial [Alphaproteobacteria bacterium]|nr:ornithine cyclodeaminase family protein [Alphaproteobacteria bacterium]
MHSAVWPPPRSTVRRTAAASALAADYLARDDAHRLTMLGTGALAPHLIEAHASVRPINHVRIWGRTPEKAVALADRFKDRFTTVEAITDKSAAIAAADIVSCATLSAAPLVHGADLGPGTHVDLVGAFRPDLRESDDQVIARGRVFVDTCAGALAEAGGGGLKRPAADGGGLKRLAADGGAGAAKAA